MDFRDFETYRRRVMLPGGWRSEQPGVWIRRDDGGAELHVFLPFQYEHGRVRWRRLAEAGLRPDGTPIPEEET